MERSETHQAQLQNLPNLNKGQLIELWVKHFGCNPHPQLRSELMRPALAYRIQESLTGQLGRSARKHSKEKSGTPFKPGTRIVREWKGQIHEVLVTAEGYSYNGHVYKSLSPIASEITGTKWSGPAFFGTRPKERRK